jgi:dGTPase
MMLAGYAMRDDQSRGRRHAEPAHPFRTAFQRDRERIVHSSAFRRMTGKTQVLVAGVNDHHRTRLTHTLEVTQVARTVARRLQLNEDLVEAIALAHDIGHPPYGHAGEQALHECLVDCSGFNHNLNGLRRVDELEERYPEFPGLNLTFEVREAFVRHAGQKDHPEFQGTGGVLLEAQVVDVVDSITYDSHDLDDALGLGLIALADVEDLDLVATALKAVRSRYTGLDDTATRTAMIRELLAVQVDHLLVETAARIARHGIKSVADVRNLGVDLVGFAEPLAARKRDLEHFLRSRVYRHHRVLRMTAVGKRILKALYDEYTRSPELLPERHLRRWSRAESILGPIHRPPYRSVCENLERVVADYLSGMTDRFARKEYERLFRPAGDDS